MHLYLRNKEYSTEVAEIHLLEGCYPKIGSLKVDKIKNEKSSDRLFGSEDNLANAIEPAIWFKVLVLDSISVDCERRAILWNTLNDVPMYREGQTFPLSLNTNASNGNIRSSSASTTRQRVSESMYIGGECYGYHSDLDEVFDKTDQLLQDYVMGLASRRQFHDTLLKLLHCYILPSIHLTAEDIEKVEEGLRVQEAAILKVDKEILAKNAKVDEVTAALRKLQDHFVAEILRQDAAKNYPAEFIDLLAQDISDRIAQSWEEIESLQSEVEDLKRLSVSIDQGDKEIADDYRDKITGNLDEKRKQRDMCFERYHSFLVVRETLKEVQNKQGDNKSSKSKSSKQKKSKGKEGLFPMCDVYAGLHDTIRDIIKDTKKLTDKKLLVISVKEALRTTLHELTSGEDSYGVSVDKTGLKKATDVLRQSSIPKEWQTLSEQVASIILDPQESLARQHSEFCEEIINKCKAAIFERELYDAALTASQQIQAADSSVSVSVSEGSVSVENKMYHLQRKRDSDKAGSSKGSVRTSADSGVLTGNDEGDKGAESQLTDVPNREKGIPIGLITSDNQDVGSRPGSHSSVGSVGLLEACSEDLISQNSLCFDNLRLTMDPNAKTKRHGIGCLPFARLSVKSNGHDTDTLPYSASGSADSDSQKDASIGSKRASQITDTSSYSSEVDGKESSTGSSTQEPQDDQLLSIPTNVNTNSTSDDLVIIYDTEKNYIRRSIDGIKSDIHKHFDSIVKELQMTLEKSDSNYYRKFWLTYENHFYEAVVDHVIKLYEVEYMQVTKSLSETVSELTLEDLELEGSLIAHILQTDPAASSSGADTPLKVRSSTETKSGCLSPISEESVEMDSSLSPLDRSMSSDDDFSRSDDSGSFGKFLRHFSMPVQRGTDVPPRTITVYHPTSVTVIYDRRTWPLPHRSVPLEETAEPGLEATALNENVLKVGEDCSDGTQPDSDSTEVKQRLPEEDAIPIGSLQLKPKYKEKFSKIFASIESVLKEAAPLLKLQHLTKCLRELSTQVTYFQMELYGGTVPICSDDLIDILVVVLCNCDPQQVGTLYAHIMLLSDIMAPFFAGGPFSFSLVQFAVAYQFIQDRLVLKKRVDRCKESDV